VRVIKLAKIAIPVIFLIWVFTLIIPGEKVGEGWKAYLAISSEDIKVSYIKIGIKNKNRVNRKKYSRKGRWIEETRKNIS